MDKTIPITAPSNIVEIRINLSCRFKNNKETITDNIIGNATFCLLIDKSPDAKNMLKRILVFRWLELIAT